jgi:hypothetical protein
MENEGLAAQDEVGNLVKRNSRLLILPKMVLL